jgi:hypothetical protein
MLARRPFAVTIMGSNSEPLKPENIELPAAANDRVRFFSLHPVFALRLALNREQKSCPVLR